MRLLLHLLLALAATSRTSQGLRAAAPPALRLRLRAAPRPAGGLRPLLSGGEGGPGEGGDDEGEDRRPERGEDGGIVGGLRTWWANEAIEDLKVYGTSLIAALLFRTLIVEPRYIPSLSMFPTFSVGDQLAVEKVPACLPACRNIMAVRSDNVPPLYR
jgi:hypothetical protein